MKVVVLSKLFVIFLGLGIAINAALGASTEEINLDLPGGDTLPITRFAADGDTLLLWTPSGFGLHGPQLKPLASAIAARGIEVWLCDFHTAYFIQSGRKSVQRFSVSDLSHVIATALKRNKKHIILISASDGAKFVLNGIDHWRRRHPASTALSGAILFHPSLYAGRPSLGKPAQYIAKVRSTTVPLYLFQPEYSTTTLRVTELRQALSSSGSRVYVHYLRNVKDGFYVIPGDRLSTADKQARTALPAWIAAATKQLQRDPVVPLQPDKSKVKTTQVDTQPGLKKIVSAKTYSFNLPTLDGKPLTLESFRGNPVIVSFWASWCPPCIRELPSMNQLAQHPKYGKIPIIMINVGEPAAQIQKFLQTHSIKANIMLDQDKTVYKQWNIYVVPSNFIFDANGKLVYGTVGAIDWNTDEVKLKLDALLEKKQVGEN